MVVDTFPVGPLQCNCTILGDEQTHEAMVVDPGGDPDVILAKLAAHRLKLKQIVITHTHIDHVSAIFELQEKAESPASIHKADLFLYEKVDVQADWLGMETPKIGAIDHFINDGDSVAVNGFEIGVIHTPGHTPGSSTFLLAGNQAMLFTGDTLFQRSIGRTDLWGGDYGEIMRSIKNRLMTFADETLVIPGHGPGTTIGKERRYNPFLR